VGTTFGITFRIRLAGKGYARLRLRSGSVGYGVLLGEVGLLAEVGPLGEVRPAVLHPTPCSADAYHGR